MIEDNDELMGQIADALRPLPRVDDEAKARVLIAVAAERERDRADVARRQSRRRRRRWFVGGTGLVAAAAIGILLVRPPSSPAPGIATPVVATTSAGASAAGARLAESRAAESPDLAAQSVQLVFKAPSATQVRVVGDFNAWDRDRLPMVRDAETGLWSVTLSLRPGRHVYAFVVDDSVWLRDPRAPAAKDTDFGRPGSVLLVGRP